MDMIFCYWMTCQTGSNYDPIQIQRLIQESRKYFGKDSPIVEASINIVPFLQDYKKSHPHILFPQFQQLINYCIHLNQPKPNPDGMQIQVVHNDSSPITPPLLPPSPNSSDVVVQPDIVQKYIAYDQFQNEHEAPQQLLQKTNSRRISKFFRRLLTAAYLSLCFVTFVVCISQKRHSESYYGDEPTFMEDCKIALSNFINKYKIFNDPLTWFSQSYLEVFTS
jgi:hypothetical protein